MFIIYLWIEIKDRKNEMNRDIKIELKIKIGKLEIVSSQDNRKEMER